MGNTTILIRVQARGGKFLGPDINFSYVWVKEAATGRILAEGAAGSGSADSGNLCPDAAVTTCPDVLPANGSSTGVVLTYSDPSSAPAVRYLTADSATAGFQASFDLTQPTLLEIVAAGADPRYRGAGTMWAVPGMQLVDPPGYVVEIPGLAVTVQHAYRVKDAVEVLAKVTMMCGCPIDSPQTAKNPAFIPWPVGEFEVNAQLWLGSQMKTTVPMALQSTSVFGALLKFPPGIDPASLTVWVTALQRKAANFGAGSFALG
jgi:hypothetical protein